MTFFFFEKVFTIIYLVKLKKRTHRKVAPDSIGFYENGRRNWRKRNLIHMTPRPPKKEGIKPASNMMAQMNFQEGVDLKSEIAIIIEAQRLAVATP